MYSRILEPRAAGPTRLDLKGYSSNIEVIADNDCRRAQIEVYTAASSGPTIKLIDELSLRESGSDVQLHLPEAAGGGNITMVSGGGFSSVNVGGMVISGGGSIVQTGRGGQTFVSTAGGDADMMVNGQRIQIRNGKTYVNGVEASGGGDAGDPGEPMAIVHIRATVPAGSTVGAEAYDGDISANGVSQVRLKTYNGNIQATGLVADSWIKSYNGDVVVGAAAGQRPEVGVETYNGDIRVLDDDVRLRPKTYNGDVRYPRR
jgi:hypothetical protein